MLRALPDSAKRGGSLAAIAGTVPAQQLVVALSLMTSASVTLQAVLAFVLLKRRIGSLGGGLFAGRVDTLKFNGYADQVASLYAGQDLTKDY